MLVYRPLNLCTVFTLLAVLAQIGDVATATPKLSKHPVLLVVSFDGFRFDYPRKADMPALRKFGEEGVSVPYMIPQFPTKTFPNHQSIATGLYPDVHGVIDNTLYDPWHDKELSGSDPEFWNFHPDVLPFWIRNEQAGNGRYSGAFMWGGSSHGYGRKGDLSWPTYYKRNYDESIGWRERVATVIDWMTDKYKPANVVFLYYNQPDSLGHSFGADGAEMVQEIKRVDDRIAHLVTELKAIGIYDKINVVILGDHGMQSVPKKNIINTENIINQNSYHRNGRSPIYHINPKKRSDVPRIYDAFKYEAKTKNFSVYKKEEMGFLNFGRNRRIGDIVLLAQPGYAFEDTHPNNVAGVHGYDNSCENMRTIFFARGPVFKKGFKSSSPIQNLDLFPMFSKIMGVSTAPNNGSMKIVGEFLN